MGKRLFWFAVGVGLTALSWSRDASTTNGSRPRAWLSSSRRPARGLVDWLGDFVSTMGEAMDQREGELREALGLDE